jgi:hypothetical protein
MGASYLWRVDVLLVGSQVFRNKLNAMDYANRMRNRGYIVEIVKWYGN